ncbi:MAG: DUF434 domain-containing protein [Theionarchaea archaeon]|nr:DUF434 domain-containing protein [Theionarchaea archaeon]
MSLHKASNDLRYLLNQGYHKSSALTFVCNHYQLEKKDRHFLARTIFSDKEVKAVKEKKLPIEKIRGKNIAIDGYNVLITTEAVLKNEAFLCDDFVLRDTQGVFGKYTVTGKTEKALQKIYFVLQEYPPRKVTFYFDQQVSHSGNLCSMTREHYPCHTIKHVDLQLFTLNNITATSDSVLIHKIDHFVDIPFEISLSKPL